MDSIHINKVYVISWSVIIIIIYFISFLQEMKYCKNVCFFERDIETVVIWSWKDI